VQQFSYVGDQRRTLKANYLLVQNIQSLLAARNEDQKALAMWAGHRPAWLSKILSGDRGIKLSDLDKIADFFGLTVAQLFQHGISTLTERRHAERRTGQDRRTGHDRRAPQGHRLSPNLDSSFFRPREYPRRTDDGSDDGDGTVQ
jgi:transcriptional regulator with XRE-family HTH domain